MNKNQFEIERELRWKSHNWSGWPGAFCLDCFLDDPLEEAVALNIENTDQWDCVECFKKENNKTGGER